MATRILLAAVVLLHCTPDFDQLRSGGTAGAASGGSPSRGGSENTATGGTTEAGGVPATSGGEAAAGSGAAAGDTSSGGEGMGAGAAGSAAGGVTGNGGSSDGGRGDGGAAQGGEISGGTLGTAGDGGNGGAPPDPSIPPPSTTCEDGCADLYVPFSNGAQQQFFTIVLSSVDLSQSVVTAKVRVTKFGSSNGFMKLYAGSAENFDYYGGPSITYIAEGEEKVLTLDLTGTPKNLMGNDWDNQHVVHLGIQINSQAGAQYGPLHLEVEEIKTSDDAIPAYSFTTAAGVIPLGVNPYQAVEGSAVTWVAPVDASAP